MFAEGVRLRVFEEEIDGFLPHFRHGVRAPLINLTWKPAPLAGIPHRDRQSSQGRGKMSDDCPEDSKAGGKKPIARGPGSDRVQKERAAGRVHGTRSNACCRRSERYTLKTALSMTISQMMQAATSSLQA
jgi:hypothetical protein